MKKLLLFLAIITVFITGFSCSSKTGYIKQYSKSQNTNVFKEVTKASEVQNDNVLLTIRLSYKCHPEGFYLIEKKSSESIDEPLSILLNIDGQAITWNIKGNIDICHGQGKQHRNRHGKGFFCRARGNPERGKGIKYCIERKISIRPGEHTFFFSIPSTEKYAKFPLKLDKGPDYKLCFIPVYRNTKLHTESFHKGLKDIEVRLNGEELPAGGS